MKVLVTGDNTEAYKEWPLIQEMVKNALKGCEFPCYAENTFDFGDTGEPILKMPNGVYISTRYLQIAD